MERQIVRGDPLGIGQSDVYQRDGRSPRAGRPTFDLVAFKLRRPLIRPGTVCRSALIGRLARDDPRPIVAVVAPVGSPGRASRERASSIPGASALTAAEPRLLALLSTHLSFPEITQEMFLACSTIKSQAMSVYRKLGVSSRSPAVARSRETGACPGLTTAFHPIRWMEPAPPRGGLVPDGERRPTGRAVRSRINNAGE